MPACCVGTHALLYKITADSGATFLVPGMDPIVYDQTLPSLYVQPSDLTFITTAVAPWLFNIYAENGWGKTYIDPG